MTDRLLLTCFLCLAFMILIAASSPTPAELKADKTMIELERQMEHIKEARARLARMKKHLETIGGTCEPRD